MRKFYRAYFATALALGFYKHVYALSSRWGGDSKRYGEDKYNAAACATQMLISDGYHQCPSCTWATEHKDEHMTPGSWCLHNGTPPVAWDEISDGSAAFDLMSDRALCRAFQ